MFELYEGRTYFWQWDANQELITTTLPIGTEVHFYHDADEKLAFKSVVKQSGSKRTCAVPNEILEQAGTIKVYAYSVSNPNARTAATAGNYTIGKKTFKVKPRPKPVA